MASLTSSQTGNWTSSTTWGGSTPAAGDTFTISAGHRVTIDSDVEVATGFGDITCHGSLYLDNSAKLVMNGRITVRASSKTQYFTEGNTSSGGQLEMRPGSEIAISGSNSDQHGVWVETEKYTSIICSGSDNNFNTTLSSSHDYQTDYLSVADASNFAAEDWITVFKRNVDYRVSTDEGMWVHDVDTGNNRIYYRQFVSPSATITKVSGTNIFVDNVKVFRKGYKIIFGTGANRNVATILSISPRRNKMLVDTSISGTVVGEKVYQTGTEKYHVDGSMVKRMATTLTTAITTADSTDQITIGDASDINVGDEILIDVNNDTDTAWDYNTRYVVTAKSGNTLTLHVQVRYVHKVGSLIVILTKDTRIRAADDSSNTRVFVYVERWTSNDGYTRRVLFRNVEFKGLGRNTSSTYYNGVMIGGKTAYLRDDTDTDGENFESAFDSCVYNSCNYLSSYAGLACRDTYRFIYRNCVSYRGERGWWGYSGNYDLRFTNFYSTRHSYSGWMSDGWYNPYKRLAYIYVTRTDDYACIVNHIREAGTIRHLILLNNEQRGFYSFYRMQDGVVVERLLQDGYRYPPYIGASGGKLTFLDCKIQPNRWDGSAEDGTGQVYSNYILAPNTDDRTTYNRGGGKSSYAEYIHFGFEENEFVQSQGGCLRTWSQSDKCWHVQVGSDTNSGFFETIFVPAFTKVRISCEVELVSGFGGTRPYLFANSLNDVHKLGRYRNQYTGQASILTSAQLSSSYYPVEVGFREQEQYSNSSLGSFENKQLTVEPQQKDYFLQTGIYNSATNIREEGYKMRDIIISVEKNTNMPILHQFAQKTKLKVRNSFTAQKKRISGRI